MIDFAANLRAFILTDTTFTAFIANYLNSKAIFTERPVPANVLFPLVLINSTPSSTIEQDFVDRKKRTLTYDILIVGENTDVSKQTVVKNAAFRLANFLDRNKNLTAPSGWRVIQTKTRGPFVGPSDDLTKTIRVVTVEITAYQTT
jgi:hypothetical protein